MGFDEFSEATLERAKKLLPKLEVIDFHWTPRQLLEQEEELTNCLFRMKSIGERIRLQSTKAQNPAEETI